MELRDSRVLEGAAFPAANRSNAHLGRQYGTAQQELDLSEDPSHLAARIRLVLGEDSSPRVGAALAIPVDAVALTEDSRGKPEELESELLFHRTTELDSQPWALACIEKARVLTHR